MLYQNYEIDLSLELLKRIFSDISDKLCLLGGWAVFLTVNERFKEDHGRDYHGSKDIDLGFHLDTIHSKEDYEKTHLYETVKYLKSQGFSGVSHSFIKFFHTENRTEILEADSKRYPSPFIFKLFVDILVDNSYISKSVIEMLKFTPIDEPLLSHVFLNNKYSIVRYSSLDLKIPDVFVLLATKINAVTKREVDHKRTKDIIDIWALLWYSGHTIEQISSELIELIDRNEIIKILSSFKKEDYSAASNAIQVDQDTISLVISSLLSRLSES